MWQLRMHCNLRPPEPRQSFSALIMTPCQVWGRWTYPLPYYSVLRLILDLWPLTFDLEHLLCIACDVMNFRKKIERNRAIRGAVNAISIYDLMTLNIALRVALDSGIIFTKFDLRQLIHAWIRAFFMLIRYVTLWPWPLTSWSWTLTALRVSCV